MDYRKFRNYFIGVVGALAFIGCNNGNNLEQKIEVSKDTVITQDEKIQQELNDFFSIADSSKNYNFSDIDSMIKAKYEKFDLE